MTHAITAKFGSYAVAAFCVAAALGCSQGDNAKQSAVNSTPIKVDSSVT